MQNDYRKAYLGVNVILVIVLYVFTEFLCTESCFVFFEKPYLDPLLSGLTGLLVTIVLINFFSQEVFTYWLRKIASWFLPLTLVLVASVDEGQGLFPMTSDGRNDTAVLMMAILFVITLIYAPIMSHRLKKRVDA